MTTLRVLGLVRRLTLASRARFSLLSLLVAVGILVFLVVTELSRVSGDGLEEAISSDIGRTGTYAVSVSDDLGLGTAGLAQVIVPALMDRAAEPVVVIENVGIVRPDCPPFEQLGEISVLVLRDAMGRPDDRLPYGHDLPYESSLCIDGVVVPATDTYLPTGTEQATYGSGLFIRSSYADLANLATATPATWRFILVTGQIEDQRDAIESDVLDVLAEAGARQGITLTDHITVVRTDRGEDVRRASDGIRMVYTIIGWGVLVLGGIGLLVAELVTMRERTWLVGLARALGARPRHVTALVLGDVALILLAGTTLALSGSLVLQPVAASFAAQAFSVEVNLLTATNLAVLAGGQALLLAIAGGWPAFRAATQDPLDVLER